MSVSFVFFAFFCGYGLIQFALAILSLCGVGGCATHALDFFATLVG